MTLQPYIAAGLIPQAHAQINIAGCFPLPLVFLCEAFPESPFRLGSLASIFSPALVSGVQLPCLGLNLLARDAILLDEAANLV
jgi:hypothetical protein